MPEPRRLPSREATEAANRAALAEADRLETKARGRRAYASAVGVGQMVAAVLFAALPIIRRDVMRELVERLERETDLPLIARKDVTDWIVREYVETHAEAAME